MWLGFPLCPHPHPPLLSRYCHWSRMSVSLCSQRLYAGHSLTHPPMLFLQTSGTVLCNYPFSWLNWGPRATCSSRTRAPSFCTVWCVTFASGWAIRPTPPFLENDQKSYPSTATACWWATSSTFQTSTPTLPCTAYLRISGNGVAASLACTEPEYLCTFLAFFLRWTHPCWTALPPGLGWRDMGHFKLFYEVHSVFS